MNNLGKEVNFGCLLVVVVALVVLVLEVYSNAVPNWAQIKSGYSGRVEVAPARPLGCGFYQFVLESEIGLIDDLTLSRYLTEDAEFRVEVFNYLRRTPYYEDLTPLEFERDIKMDSSVYSLACNLKAIDAVYDKRMVAGLYNLCTWEDCSLGEFSRKLRQSSYREQVYDYAMRHISIFKRPKTYEGFVKQLYNPCLNDIGEIKTRLKEFNAERDSLDAAYRVPVKGSQNKGLYQESYNAIFK